MTGRKYARRNRLTETRTIAAISVSVGPVFHQRREASLVSNAIGAVGVCPVDDRGHLAGSEADRPPVPEVRHLDAPGEDVEARDVLADHYVEIRALDRALRRQES